MVQGVTYASLTMGSYASANMLISEVCGMSDRPAGWIHQVGVGDHRLLPRVRVEDERAAICHHR